MSPDDHWRLRHMAEAIEQALAFTRLRTRADLASDVMLRLALAQLVQIVGEAAARMSDAGRTEIQDVPWAQVVGMRNRLVHAYFDINQDILWDTVQQAFPKLLRSLAPHLGGE